MLSYQQDIDTYMHEPLRKSKSLLGAYLLGIPVGIFTLYVQWKVNRLYLAGLAVGLMFLFVPEIFCLLEIIRAKKENRDFGYPKSVLTASWVSLGIILPSALSVFLLVPDDVKENRSLLWTSLLVVYALLNLRTVRSVSRRVWKERESGDPTK